MLPTLLFNALVLVLPPFPAVAVPALYARPVPVPVGGGGVAFAIAVPVVLDGATKPPGGALAIAVGTAAPVRAIGPTAPVAEVLPLEAVLVNEAPVVE